MKKRLNPPQVVAISFLVAIIIGTILLSLPLSNRGPEKIKFIDAIFTATSATCVTGLIVQDTSTFFSHFGQWVILILFQAGGLGIMTLSMLFAILLGRKLTIKENVTIQSALNHHKIEGVSALIKYILSFTLGLEFLGALLLFLKWNRGYGFSAGQAAWNSLFHSISAFCNAGFSLFSNSFMDYQGDLYITLVISIMIILGGIGFVVLLDIKNLKFWKRNKDFTVNRFTLQTKIVLILSATLILIATLAFLTLENNGILQGLSWKNKILASYFQSVTSRTAGFNTVNIGGLGMVSQLLLIFLMFIGASPGSTGGGIKTATFGILLVTIWSMLKNRDRISVFKRTIPRHVVRKALVVFFMALAWILIFTIALSITEGRNMENSANPFLSFLFEVTSAFGTVGLSTGMTPYLSTLGKILIILTMYAGRIGPLTLALAIAIREEKIVYKYPEERIMVG
jgi:trk system potassium uptake protein TrkH